MTFVLPEGSAGFASLQEIPMRALAIAIDSKDSIIQYWAFYDLAIFPFFGCVGAVL